METFRNTLRSSALAMAITALSITGAAAQNYNSGYRDNSYGNRYEDNYSDDDGDYDATYQDFYDELSPYGQWINDPTYGYVWAPDVDRNFRPYYTNGYWAQTQDYGSTWISNYNWGWATFHYGRWTYDNSYGWVWIPGTEWAPAWVNWRSADDGYYGWAPMGPGYDVDYYSSNINYYGPSSWWVFAPQQYLYSNNFYSYVRPSRYNNNYLRSSRFLSYGYRNNGYRYFTGPRRAEIERATGRTIPTYRIRNTERPGSTRITGGSAISMYRPRVGSMERNINTRPVRPANFRQGRLNIVEGGGRPVNNPTEGIRQPGSRSQGGGGQPYRQQNEFGQRNNSREQLQPQRSPVQEQPRRAQEGRSIQPQQERQAAEQNDRARQDRIYQQRGEEQMQQQRAQQEQVRIREQQQAQQESARRQQSEQRERQQQEQVRTQQEYQRAQMQQQRAQQEQARQQQDQQRTQQEQSRIQQEQLRSQQEQQRAQQEQQRAQMQQQRAQQEQIREQQRVQQPQQRMQQQEIQRQQQPVQRQERPAGGENREFHRR